jgi:CRP-like cAMP-binding protein
MKTTSDKLLPAVRLEYKRGDLIVKEGDYGISVYHIISGKVGVFVGSGEKEVSVSSLGSGEIIGEMIFLSGYNSRRSASIRALEDSVLEAWHPSRIKQDYDDMPPVIRRLAGQVLTNLVRANRQIAEMAKKKAPKPPKTAPPSKKNWKTRAYRKDVDMDCLYRPFDATEKVRLWGRIKNISKTGIRLDVTRMNALDYSHDIGRQFKAYAFLSNDRQIEILVEVANSRLLEDNRTLALGMKFVGTDAAAERAIGFLFLG